jgi:hypothetical protein
MLAKKGSSKKLAVLTKYADQWEGSGMGMVFDKILQSPKKSQHCMSIGMGQKGMPLWISMHIKCIFVHSERIMCFTHLTSYRGYTSSVQEYLQCGMKMMKLCKNYLVFQSMQCTFAKLITKHVSGFPKTR